jgi:hypothetical protein
MLHDTGEPMVAANELQIAVSMPPIWARTSIPDPSFNQEGFSMFPAGSTGFDHLTINSTSVFLPVNGTIIDRSLGLGYAVSFLCIEQGGVNGITVKVQASIDGATWDDDTGEVPVAAGTHVVVFGAGSGARYYQLAIKDTVANSHGVAVVSGYAH